MGKSILRRVILRYIRKDVFKILPDKAFIKLQYYAATGKRLNLKKPVLFNEKIQWLKLNDKNPVYPILVDKYRAKKYISKQLGKDYVIPTLKIWSSVDEIEWDKLPEKFVIKTTHDSGCAFVCKDKNSFDTNDVSSKLNSSMKESYYWPGREWPYKYVKPRILVEQYMCDDSSVPEEKQELSDYKFYCFNGQVDCVMICYDRASGDTKYYFFDENWTLKRINKRGKAAPKDFTLPKPVCLEKMFTIASSLSKGLPFVRVDLYQSDGRVYFGEMTFYPQSGFDPNYLPETDRYFGDKIDIDLVKQKRLKRNGEY